MANPWQCGNVDSIARVRFAFWQCLRPGCAVVTKDKQQPCVLVKDTSVIAFVRQDHHRTCYGTWREYEDFERPGKICHTWVYYICILATAIKAPVAFLAGYLFQCAKNKFNGFKG